VRHRDALAKHPDRLVAYNVHMSQAYVPYWDRFVNDRQRVPATGDGFLACPENSVTILAARIAPDYP